MAMLDFGCSIVDRNRFYLNAFSFKRHSFEKRTGMTLARASI